MRGNGSPPLKKICAAPSARTQLTRDCEQVVARERLARLSAVHSQQWSHFVGDRSTSRGASRHWPSAQRRHQAIPLIVPAGNVYESANQVWLADLTGRMLQGGPRTGAADALARELAAMDGSLVAVGPDTTSIGPGARAERAAGIVVYEYENRIR